MTDIACTNCGSRTFLLEQTAVRIIEIVNGKRQSNHAYRIAEQILQCKKCGKVFESYPTKTT